MNLENLAPRFREDAFRRYESIITHAVAVHPARYVIPPRPGISQETVSCRLRDAMRSLALYRWQPTSVDMVKFDTAYPSACVLREHDNVVVAWNKKTATPLTQVSPGLTLTIPITEEVLHGLCWLVQHKQVSSVQVNQPLSTWKDVTVHYDIGAVLRDDGSLLIV